MTKAEFLKGIEQIVEAPEGALKGDEALSALAGWDSMSTLAFIAMADRQLGIVVSPAALAQCETVADLVKLVGNKLTE